MTALRGDIADAVGRMAVSFGTRSAIRHLGQALLDGETVRELAACLFAGSDGLLVLTDRRILAVRDDYSRYLVRACDLAALTCYDYAPTVHDGLAVFTAEVKLAVRPRHSADAERLMSALQTSRPDLPLWVLAGNAVALPPGSGPTGAPVPVPAGSGTSGAPQDGATVTVAAPGSASVSVDADGATVVVTPTPSGFGAPYQPEAVSVAVASAPPASPEADREVLRGVLTDLHARGLLSDQELAVKVALLDS